MRFGGSFLAALGVIFSAWVPSPLHAQTGGRVQWIWFNEGEPANDAPPGKRYFRKLIELSRSVDEATLDITADDEFTVWINGREVGKGNDWRRVYAFDVKQHLVTGKNVISVEARNKAGAAGLMVRLAYVPNGYSRTVIVSDGAWKASKTAAEGWQKPEFDAKDWSVVKVLGNYGAAGPWKNQIWDSGGDDRFAVPPGFVVEKVVNPRGGGRFSLINLTFDAKGDLLISQERGPVLICTDQNKDGVFQTVKPYCTAVRSCQGMCWVKDALYLVGDGPAGVGLYRCSPMRYHAIEHPKDRVTDSLDDVQIVHKFPKTKVPNYNTIGGMGEHGPHAIVHGPDDWLYMVLGNHVHAGVDKLASNSPLLRWPQGLMGPDQDQPDTTEDVLLPRHNDGRGHASNILAPGGTIWRLDHQGKNMSLVAAGFRNQYDVAFSPSGELFTFDSDMEWDVGLPWYRAVRVCHCPPGADFVWRTGTANTPNYYIDSLPPLLETGRGSPVGVEFYDHHAFPEKYRGAFFMGDWAIGVIFAVHLERDGAGYKAKAEKFCVGAPMNVTDLITGPDGALYFTMGGRDTQGGVYRIRYTGSASKPEPASLPVNTAEGIAEELTKLPQPYAAWSRRALANHSKKTGVGEEDIAKALAAIALSPERVPRDRIRALIVLETQGHKPDAKTILPLIEDRNVFVRAHGVWLCGANQIREGRELLIAALADGSPLVRRRSCEALIRLGVEPPVEVLWPLLGDKDKYVRTAARLALQRIDPKKWASRISTERNNLSACEAIIALCKANQAAPLAEPIFDRLHQYSADEDVQALLDYLRTVQMALIHTAERPGSVRGIALECLEMFPHKDSRVNRELAILLAYFRWKSILTESVEARLMNALLAAKDDRMQQIHYFFCLRLLHNGWAPARRQALLAWFESTKNWEAGHSFTPFMENILRDFNPIFTAEDRAGVLAMAETMPWTAAALLRIAEEQQLPRAALLGDLYRRLVKIAPFAKQSELKEAVIAALSRSPSAEAPAALRVIADSDPAQRDAMAKALARFPSPENWPYVVRGLQSTSSPTLVEVIQALKKFPAKPSADDKGNPTDPGPYRALLLASAQMLRKDRWQAVELLRYWGNRKFTPEDGDWKPELEGWSRWFSQTFPKEPPLPNVTAIAAQSKWKFDELQKFLENDPKGRSGDVARGRIVFEKANCIKCHKFGKDGEGIGPDLTALKSRFKRVDTLESILYPSKVISDQYRGTTFTLTDGTIVFGLAATQGNTVTVLQLDASKRQFKAGEVEAQVASTVSVMPEKLIDELSLQEIADLFAYLDSEPPK